MAVEQHRIGDGDIRIIRGSIPTQNEDGSPYVHGPEDYFLWFLTNDQGLSANDPVVDPRDPAFGGGLVKPIATELVSGEFSEVFDVDSQAVPGLWRMWYRTVNVIPGGNTDGTDMTLFSLPSNELVIEVLPPLSAPLPPDIS